jgi:hypothetical protein
MVRRERFHRKPDVRVGDIDGTQIERVVEVLYRGELQVAVLKVADAVLHAREFVDSLAHREFILNAMD